MIECPMIDDVFIERWHPRYDETEDDEGEYEAIINKVSDELSRKGSLSKDTFIRILDWKAPRVKGVVRLDEFGVYEKAIRECFRTQDDSKKLAILDELYGIDIPVASTILHFMYPDSFPIMDVRTAEVLHAAGYIESKCRNQKHYGNFRSAILGIAENYANTSLRKIDRALFAFHKIYFERQAKDG